MLWPYDAVASLRNAIPQDIVPDFFKTFIQVPGRRAVEKKDIKVGHCGYLFADCRPAS